MAHDPDDPEMALRPRRPVEELPLFTPWPEAPAAHRGEQRELSIRPSPEAILDAWRATPEGREVFDWIVGRAFEQVAAGATRLSAKHLLEQARSTFKHAADNRITPALARCLEDEHPVLHGYFEKRRRSA